MIETLSNMMRSYKREKECHLFFPDLFDLTLPFKKRSEILITGYTYFDIITKKTKTIEFYDYYDHLNSFCFEWRSKDAVYTQIEKKVD